MNFLPLEGFPEGTSWGTAVSGYGVEMWRLANAQAGNAAGFACQLYNYVASDGGSFSLENGWLKMVATSKQVGTKTMRGIWNLKTLSTTPKGLLRFGCRVKVENYTGTTSKPILRMYGLVTAGNYNYQNLLTIDQINDGKEHYFEMKYFASTGWLSCWLDEQVIYDGAASSAFRTAINNTSGSWWLLWGGGGSDAAGDNVNMAGTHWMRDIYFDYDLTDTVGNGERLGPIRIVPLPITSAVGADWTIQGTAASKAEVLNKPLTDTDLETPYLSCDETSGSATKNLDIQVDTSSIPELAQVKSLIMGTRVRRETTSGQPLKASVVGGTEQSLTPTTTSDTYRTLTADLAPDGLAWNKSKLTNATLRLRTGT